MARISTYDFDGTLSNTDKVIGTDSSDTATKNFKLQDLKEFIFSGISGPVTINSLGVSSVTFPDVTLGTDTSGSYVESLVAGDGIQLLNNSGEGATPTVKVNPLQTTITSILNTGLCVGRDSTDKICFTTDNQIRFTVNNALDLILAENSLTPGTSDGTALGTSSLMWSDLFLASESVINFDNGNVTVTHGNGVLQIDTDSKLEFRDNAIFINSSADGQLDIDADDEVEINSAKIDIDATGNGSDAIVIEATAGGIDILASGAAAGEDIDITATGSSVNITSTENDASAIHLNASAGGINIDASSGDIDIDSSTVDMLTTSTMVLLSQSTTSLKGNTGATFGDDTEQIVFDGSGNVDFDAVTLDIDASSTMTLDGTGVSIDGTLDSNFTVTGSGKDLTLSVAGGGTQQLILNSAGTGSTNAIVINSSAGGLDIDAAAGASIDAVGIAINSGSGELDLTTSGTMDVNSVAFDLDASGAITIDGTSTVSIDGAGATNLTTSSGNITIDSAAGSVLVDGHTGVEITSTSSGTVVIDGKTGVSIEEDGTAVISIDTNRDTVFSSTGGSTGDPDVEFDGYTRFDDQVEVSDTTNSTSVSTGALIVDGGVGVASNLNVGGTLEANGLTYPANVNDANINEVLTKTSNGTIGFSTPASVGVSANTDDSDRTVVFANGNVLHDDNDTVSSSSFKYNPNDKILTVNNIVPKTSDDGSLGTSALSYSDLFLANGGIIEFKAGTGNRSQITHFDGTSGNEGSLRLSAKTKLEFNDANSYIASLDANNLDLVATTEVQIVSPSLNFDGAANISGNLVLASGLSVGGHNVTDIDDNTSLGTSDVKLATQNAIKTYVDAQITAEDLDVTSDSGTIDIDLNSEILDIAGGNAISTSATGTTVTINHDDTSSQSDVNNSGSTFVQDLTFDTYGHVTGVTSVAVPTLNQDTTGTASKVTVTDYSSGVFPIVLHNDANQLFDDTDHFQFKQTSSTISSVTDTQFTLTLGETTDYAHYLHGGNIDFKSGATISSHDAGLFFMGNAYYKLVSGSGAYVKKISGPSELLRLRDQELSFSVHTLSGSAGDSISFTKVFDVDASGNLTVTGELEGTSLDINGAADISGATNISGAVAITDTTQATSTTTGALKVAGGVGVEKDIYVEEQLFIGNAAGSDSTTARSIFSKYSGSNFLELTNSSSSNGGRVIVGATSSGFNGIYSRNHDASAGREFRIIQLSTAVITVATGGDTTFTGNVTANNFIISSDKRLKSEIEPIKEGLEVIKQFTSYNYVKGGEKESGFIAQEVREAIPHTVYENNEGYLSMSDRGVLAHIHKAILEIDKRLEVIEEKIK